MTGEAALIAGRARANSRMTSTGTVRRKTGATTTSPTTGLPIPVWTAVYTNRPFRLGGSDVGGSTTRTVTVGGIQVQSAVRVASFAYDTTGLQDNDYIDVTAGENAGLALRIIEADWQDQSTARRVPVVAEQRPEGW